MPSTPSFERASRTASSLNGLMIASSLITVQGWKNALKETLAGGVSSRCAIRAPMQEKVTLSLKSTRQSFPQADSASLQS